MPCLYHAGSGASVRRFSVTEVCREWTQPDGLHFRGKCVNEFWPKAGATGCNICVEPTYTPATCDLWGTGSELALNFWRGQYYVGPPAFSLLPASNWLDTWHPFLHLRIPSGVFASGVFGDPDSELGSGYPSNPAYSCPALYNGDFVLKSQSHCADWIGIDSAGDMLRPATTSCDTTFSTSAPRFKLLSTTISNLGIFFLWVELQITYKLFHPGPEYQIRCRTAPQPTQLYFNMGSTFEFYQARNAISGSPWFTFRHGPITVTPF